MTHPNQKGLLIYVTDTFKNILDSGMTGCRCSNNIIIILSLVFADTLMLTHRISKAFSLLLYMLFFAFLHFSFFYHLFISRLVVFIHTCTLKFLHTVIFFMLSLSHRQFSCTESVPSPSLSLCVSISHIVSFTLFSSVVVFSLSKALFHIQWFSNPSGVFKNGGGAILGFSLPRYISLLTPPLT